MALVFDKYATLGATFIGFGASSVCVLPHPPPLTSASHTCNRLFGVVCAQSWTYLGRYPEDKSFYKILVRRFPLTHKPSSFFLLLQGILSVVCCPSSPL